MYGKEEEGEQREGGLLILQKSSECGVLQEKNKDDGRSGLLSRVPLASYPSKNEVVLNHLLQKLFVMASDH